MSIVENLFLDQILVLHEEMKIIFELNYKLDFKGISFGRMKQHLFM